ncbi:unnamed protein product [Rotaria magnacalcarata]|uniref:ELMO domain-containing protein n=3 Tax=Rotaria magnacalcarata TaxID=392030 RepID=A0A814RY13_9BILA|nr:unnamed protein product [Rotaria magnacalcarata]CAF1676418.1 unnamed protein product [Rotaria magnacalcarata]CAF2146473.1 unnamed protein product [Rotaria magnacalcarata]CAF4033875.1 unnamed protein product [Rotaria magnacalcarata]CAF4076721.1 unnamed protein product [Rotaria magnacalcarata]
MPFSLPIRVISQWLLLFQRIFMFILTGKSMLERIIANRTISFPLRVYQIKNSINFTSSKSLDYEINQTKIDKNKSLIHDQLYTVIHKLELYQKLISQIDEIRKTQVTSTDAEHLDLFEKIWSRLVTQSNDDHEPMRTISKRWTKIGFQGPNPLTDFRGMGVLGLQSIEYLSRDESTCLTYVNIRPPNDYSFAIGVINAVSWLVALLEIESSKNDITHPLLTYFSVHPCNVNEFFRLFSFVFNEWHQFWIDQKADIMQFEQLSKRFRAQMLVECQQGRPLQQGFSKRIPKQ